MQVTFQEDTIKLTLEPVMLQALTEAISEKAQDIESRVDYNYRAFSTKFGYTEIATLRDLKRLHQVLSKKLENSIFQKKPKVTISLQVSYVYLLHEQIVFSFDNPFLQSVIDQLDHSIKSYRLADQMQLR
ncbi:hypothetical protein QNI16_07170 [Cytophagaceae bacterium YF14B1]|uniref:Uncharacterized protein n=1 Tax=Xanthocytophaga flava TaxID=3048013 RepID=A0AAE3U836_9BACT|nr:hypothetical protein [Xanthocytophaga flavus]MDJ1480259.1 hypothetical protein [Xanthocytophaga flavus]